MSSSSEDSSNDSDTQSPDDRTVSDSDPGSVYPGHSQSNADARDSDWETEDENYEDLSDTEFHTPGEFELAHNVLTKGKFRNQKDWDRIARKYLTLPTSQYEKLSQDIQLVDVFDQRPLFAVIQRLNRELIRLRDIGEDCGLKFPANAPARSGKSVPRDGRKVLDKLRV